MRRYALALSLVSVLGVAPAKAVVLNAGVEQGSRNLAAMSLFSGIGAVLTPAGQGQFGVCTGSLVSTTQVLTSAHCLDQDRNGKGDFAPSSIQFKTGPDISTGATATRFGTSVALENNWWLGPSGSAEFDLAILTINAPVPGTVIIQPNASPAPNQALIIGYGQGGTGDTGGTLSAGIKRAAQNAPYFNLVVGDTLQLTF
jgi:hypothetical protein